MTFFRKALAVLTLTVLAGAALSAAPPELLKHVPGDGTFYGEVAFDELRKAPLYQQMIRKFPKVQKLLDQKFLDGYAGDLQAAVFTAPGCTREAAVLLRFSAPVKADAIADALKRQGLSDLYEKRVICGRTGYVARTERAGGNSCFILLGDGIMLCCMEASAEELLKAPKISGDLRKKLAAGTGKQVFFRLFPGVAEPDSSALDFYSEASLPPDQSLVVSFRLNYREAQKAAVVEKQIRQWMMIGMGVLFADDGELGMELLQRIRVVRKDGLITVNAAAPKSLVERLIDYGIRQGERREQQRRARLRKQEERRKLSTGKSTPGEKR